MLDVWKSLSNPSYFRRLSNQNEIVDKLQEMYSDIEYPYPDKYSAKVDYYKFLDWKDKDTMSSSRFGKTCCEYYIKSMIDARVKNLKSFRELWNDKEIMRTAIMWQLLNENNVHNAERFLRGACYKNGFRTISNLNASRIVIWLKKYGNIKKGGIFFDFSAGWGNRMLAAKALGMRYRAIDANKKLVDELNNMAIDLGIDAKVIYGSSDDINCYKKLLGDEKIDLAFTSPPYFDKEIYSEDEEQSIIKYPNEQDWYEKFIVKSIENVILYSTNECSILMNVDKSFKVKLIEQKFQFEDYNVPVEYKSSITNERLLRYVNKNKKENIDFVYCEICHKKFKRLGRHLRAAHDIEPKKYSEKYPDKLLICKKESDRVGRDNSKSVFKNGYKQRVVYKLPNGDIAKKKDKWLKEWDNNPPENTIIDATTIDLDKWKDKIKNVDYVECTICGHKGKNIKRHIEKHHLLELSEYNGETQCLNSKNKISNASLKMWGEK